MTIPSIPMNMDTLNTIGLMAGMFTTVGYVPQIMKGVRTKRMDDVSLAMPIILGIGLAFWTIYGIAVNSFPIIFWDTISFLLVAAIIVMKLRYRRNVMDNCPVQGGEGVGQG